MSAHPRTDALMAHFHIHEDRDAMARMVANMEADLAAAQARVAELEKLESLYRQSHDKMTLEFQKAEKRVAELEAWISKLDSSTVISPDWVRF